MLTTNKHIVSPETVICIIRHGETDWNSLGKLQGREDVELNDLGLLPEERRSRFPEGIPDQENFEHLRQRAMNGINKILKPAYIGKISSPGIL